ncbi:MAG: choice-of-anchor Q domain-containing protein [Pseudomonadota bacterium]
MLNLMALGYSGEGNINADPLFVNDVPGPTLDLHLTAGSPAIDVGIPESAPDTDFDGNPRPSGKGYDMGAYEYQQPVTLLQFSQADYHVTEDGASITIKVTREGDSL